MDKWNECPQEWYYGYKEQLKRQNQNTFHMDRGTYFHRLCHYYYNLLRTGYRPGSPTVRAAMEKKIKEDLKEMTVDTVTLLATSQPQFLDYIENYSPKIDMNIKIVEVEYEFHVLVQTPKGRFIFLHGFIDLVYRDLMNRLRVRDHKTGERKDTWNQEKAKFDNQLFFYDLAMYILYGEQIDVVEINFINLAKKPEKKFEMFKAEHEPVQLENYRVNLLKILDKILDSDIHRNYSKNCPSCSFYKLCTLESKNLPVASTISMLFERTNRGHKPGFNESPKATETVSRPTVTNDPRPEIVIDLGDW